MKLLFQGFEDKLWYTKGYIFGAALSIKGYIMALHDLDPISQLVRPENISELRRVLGLCFWSNRDKIMHYSRAWSDSMLGEPPYYQEADALVTGLSCETI